MCAARLSAFWTASWGALQVNLMHCYATLNNPSVLLTLLHCPAEHTFVTNSMLVGVCLIYTGGCFNYTDNCLALFHLLYSLVTRHTLRWCAAPVGTSD